MFAKGREEEIKKEVGAKQITPTFFFCKKYYFDIKSFI